MSCEKIDDLAILADQINTISYLLQLVTADIDSAYLSISKQTPSIASCFLIEQNALLAQKLHSLVFSDDFIKPLV